MKPNALLWRPSLAAFCALTACGFLAVTPFLWTSGGSADDALMVTSVLLALCWLFVRIGRARVVVRDGGLDVIDWWSRTWIPWGAYLRLESEDGLVLFLRGDVEHCPAALGGSLVENMLSHRGKGRVLGAAKTIRAASREASAEARADRHVTTRRWEFIPADALLGQLPFMGLLVLTGIVSM
ncbi:hypothetical protein QZH56_36090 [Streptomyces olivoreticuli]|uniref:hypothetical protein n=1 Tax=Streptomyces olivoreticuli TaxID=68246 RepID=UPI002659D163|nr:hypothetical protein [Streptomyces olivoreticuli]WKK24031.1 hypothetical protein QZH56_36090 [Streptomyces olivoreticuli]